MASSSSPCTVTLDDGTHYDLSSLSSSKSDYLAEAGSANGTTYKLNVCRAVVSELWKVDEPESVAGFASRGGGDFSLGKVNTSVQVSPGTNQPLLFLQNGSPCPLDPQVYASTAIRFICSPSDFHAGRPVLVTALPPGDPANYCQFFFEWSTHVACPTNAKAELQQHHYYIAFAALLLIAVLTWFGGMTLYNRLHLKRRGIEQFPIPSFHFPSLHLPTLRVPFLTREPASTTKAGFGWRRRSQRSGYTGVRAYEDDEDEGFAGRFSLDDDDEEGAEDLTSQGVAARALGGETDAWRGNQRGPPAGGSAGLPSVAVHGGLVDV